MREDPGGVFFEFVVKRALKQDQIVHLEGKLQFILYFSRECVENRYRHIYLHNSCMDFQQSQINRETEFAKVYNLEKFELAMFFSFFGVGTL